VQARGWTRLKKTNKLFFWGPAIKKRAATGGVTCTRRGIKMFWGLLGEERPPKIRYGAAGRQGDLPQGRAVGEDGRTQTKKLRTRGHF